VGVITRAAAKVDDILNPLLPPFRYSPRLLLYVVHLSHAASCVLVRILLRLNAHPLMHPTQDIHLSPLLLETFKWPLFFLFREREAELLLHRLIAAIAECWKCQQLKQEENRTVKDLFVRLKFQVFRDMALRHSRLTSSTDTHSRFAFDCVSWCIPSESNFFLAFTESNF
jgi:hypothetical protein